MLRLPSKWTDRYSSFSSQVAQSGVFMVMLLSLAPRKMLLDSHLVLPRNLVMHTLPTRLFLT